jgi:hypothetical protein
VASVLVLSYCGLRPAEIDLRRRHLDEFGRLTSEGAMSGHRGRLVEQDTKTHRARLVQIPASVLDELRAHLDAHGEDDAQAPIFTTPAAITSGRAACTAECMAKAAGLSGREPSTTSPVWLTRRSSEILTGESSRRIDFPRSSR